MKLIVKIVKKIKGKDFTLDENISLTYIIGLCIEMTMNLVRGTIKTIFVKKGNKIIFIGKRTKLKARRSMNLGSSVNIGSYVVIDALSKNGVKIGDKVRVSDYTRILCTGSIKKVGVGFEIGNNCGIGEYCFFGAAGGIKIGNDVIMGQNVRFHSENHVFKDKDELIRLQGVTNKGILVGNNCWIGAGAVFLDGVTVGNGCVIGANAVINKDIPDNSIAVGNPCRIIERI